MRRIIAVILSLCLAICICGCSSNNTPININVDNSSDLSGATFGRETLIAIRDFLYYDSTTRIVYWWNGRMGGGYSSTTPSPYFAPNGLPYRYNPETNTFEEIEQ
ncbi:MAG: hypothetical protein ACI4KR_07770 [Ruminiclostridium sp.]